MSEWLSQDTGKHQDHVIAHVIGSTVLGYFECDQAAYLVLDIGFIWTIFVDGEMGLVPQSMAINELDLDAEAKTELLADLDLVHNVRATTAPSRMTAAPVECLIVEVGFYAQSNRRRIRIIGEEASIAVDSSLETGLIEIYPILNEAASA